MKCSKCGGATRVKDSREGDAPHNSSYNWLLAKVRKVWAWWSTEDFHARWRKCPLCEREFATIELELEDLENALADARSAKSKLPHKCPVCIENTPLLQRAKFKMHLQKTAMDRSLHQPRRTPA